MMHKPHKWLQMYFCSLQLVQKWVVIMWAGYFPSIIYLSNKWLWRMRFFALLARASRGRSKLFVSLQSGLQIRMSFPCERTHETSIPIHGMTAVHNLKIRASDNIFMLSNASSCHRVGCTSEKCRYDMHNSFQIWSDYRADLQRDAFSSLF